MPVHRFSVAQLAPVPWKNGGGVTREIVCMPRDAGLDDFDWRVSIADIDEPGPFSAFAGIDRVITLLGGAGVRLHSRDGAIDHRLDTPLQPFAFSGDAAVHAELLGGRCSDLNVMARRRTCRARVRVLRVGDSLPAAAAGVLLAVRGAWQAACDGQVQALAPEDGLWWHGTAASWQLAAPAQGAAALVAVLVDRA
jgi:uncharacterized protein